MYVALKLNRPKIVKIVIAQKCGYWLGPAQNRIADRGVAKPG